MDVFLDTFFNWQIVTEAWPILWQGLQATLLLSALVLGIRGQPGTNGHCTSGLQPLRSSLEKPLFIKEMLRAFDAPHNVERRWWKIDVFGIRAAEPCAPGDTEPPCGQGGPMTLHRADRDAQAVALTSSRQMNRRCPHPAADIHELVSAGNAGEIGELFCQAKLRLARRLVGFPEAMMNMGPPQQTVKWRGHVVVTADNTLLDRWATEHPGTR